MKVFKLIYKVTNKVKEKVAALSEKGQGMVEYAMIIAAVAVIAVAVLWSNDAGGLKGSISTAFSNAAGQVTEATQKSTTP